MATTFDMDVSTGTFTAVSIKNGYIWAGLAIAFAIVLALYVLRSIGLYILAKRQNVKNAFLAWIPCVWFYILCKLIGKTRLFNVTYEKVAIWLCIVFAVAEMLSVVISIVLYLPLLQYSLIEGGTLYIAQAGQLDDGMIRYMTIEGGLGVYGTKIILPFGMDPASYDNLVDTLNLFSMIFELASIIITISAYFAFFRKYLPRHYMLASLLSIFIPVVFAPFVFACRNKNAVDFNEYIRSRYQQYQNPYGNNPYNQGGYNGYSQPKQPDNPFSEFAEKGEADPFSEFSENKNKDPFDEFNNNN